MRFTSFVIALYYLLLLLIQEAMANAFEFFLELAIPDQGDFSQL